MAAPHLDAKELADLWRRMYHAAGTGAIPLAPADAEDVTQDAMLRLVQEEERKGAPPLIVRGLWLLRQAKVEHVRRRNRAKEPKLQVIEGDGPEFAVVDAGMRLIELKDLVQRELGADGLEAALSSMIGETEEELGRRVGWTPARAHAARRRIRRGKKRLLEQLLDDD